MTSKLSRSALIAALAVGASGLVAVPAAEASFQTGTGLVNQPIVSAATQITPESAVISGAVDTGGFLQPNNSTASTVAGGFSVAVTPGSTWAGGVSGTGYPVSSTTTSITIDGIPLTTPGQNGSPVPTFSGVWVEYDPLADFEAAGGVPGPETQFAPEEDVDTSAAPYTEVPPFTIGGYPASTAEDNGQSPLTPNTTYVYWIEQQTAETTAATTINEFNPVDLYQFLDETTPSGSGASAGAGGTSVSSLFGESGDIWATDNTGTAQHASTPLTWGPSNPATPYGTGPYTNADDETAWQNGTGIYGANGFGAANLGVFAGKIGYTDAGDKSETLNLTSLANPDYQCAPDYDLVSGGPFEVNTVGQPWGSYTNGGTVSGGIASFANGALTYAGAQDEFQGGTAAGAACVDFLGSTANQNFFITSGTGEFTTSKLGTVVFGSKASVSGKWVIATVKDKSSLNASGSVELTAKVGKKKNVDIASGSFKVIGNGSATFKLKLTKKGTAALNKSKNGKLSTRIVYTSNTDQPTSSKKITI